MQKSTTEKIALEYLIVMQFIKYQNKLGFLEGNSPFVYESNNKAYDKIK
jgi:hypothetical protein